MVRTIVAVDNAVSARNEDEAADGGIPPGCFGGALRTRGGGPALGSELVDTCEQDLRVERAAPAPLHDVACDRGGGLDRIVFVEQGVGVAVQVSDGPVP